MNFLIRLSGYKLDKSIFLNAPLHEYSRTAVDFDGWINKTLENNVRIKRAFHLFEMLLSDNVKIIFLQNYDFKVSLFGKFR